MWKIKYFTKNPHTSEKDARQWMKEHDHLYVMELIFVENGCAVEYKYLYKI